MNDPKTWPRIRRKNKVKSTYTPPPIFVPKRAPIVIQPKGSYPRFSYTFNFRKPNGKPDIMIMLAYNDEMAEKQARSLAVVFSYKFVSVEKRFRMDWTNFTRMHKEDWYNKSFLPDWKKYKTTDNLKE